MPFTSHLFSNPPPSTYGLMSFLLFLLLLLSALLIALTIQHISTRRLRTHADIPPTTSPLPPPPPPSPPPSPPPRPPAPLNLPPDNFFGPQDPGNTSDGSTPRPWHSRRRINNDRPIRDRPVNPVDRGPTLGRDRGHWPDYPARQTGMGADAAFENRRGGSSRGDAWMLPEYPIAGYRGGGWNRYTGYGGERVPPFWVPLGYSGLGRGGYSGIFTGRVAPHRMPRVRRGYFGDVDERMPRFYGPRVRGEYQGVIDGEMPPLWVPPMRYGWGSTEFM